MAPSTSPPPRSPRPAPPSRRGLALAALALVALVCVALPSRSAPNVAAEAPADMARLSGPFGSSLGVGGGLFSAWRSWRPSLHLRLHLSLDLAPFDRDEP